MVMEEFKYLFKVVLIGNTGVGKTCLVRQFTQGLFPPGQGSTIGVDFMIKTIDVNKEPVKIWDTAGQERFRSITQSYYRSANALILVYDMCCEPSFDSLPQWLQEIDMYANEQVLKYLVGNKSDLVAEREVATSVGEEFARRHGMCFLETSAKAADNVDALFNDIAHQLVSDAIRDGMTHTMRSADTTSLGGSSPVLVLPNCCRFS